MRTRFLATAVSVALVLPVSSLAVDFTSAATGFWDATNIGTWSPAGNPQTGTTDTVSILTGHVVTFSDTTGVGLPGSGDLGVSNNQVININGGVLTQSLANFWIRIGNVSDGTLNINDGRFHFTDNINFATTNLQVGIRAASGFIKVGDGIGLPGSAILNLRDIVSGVANGANVGLNLAATEDLIPDGVAGSIVINSDGVLEGDVRLDAANSPVIRVGQGSSATQSSVVVNAGGKFNVHGTLEVGSNAGANGFIRVDGNGARLDMDNGELNVGLKGTGALVLDHGAVFSRVNSAAERLDLKIGSDATGVGTVVLQNNAQLLRGPGANVGDFRIGVNGAGSMTISAGALFLNESANGDWVGQ